MGGGTLAVNTTGFAGVSPKTVERGPDNFRSDDLAVPLSPNTHGALLMTGSMAAFTLNDTFMKLIGTDIPLFQLLLLRSIAVMVLLGGFIYLKGNFRKPAMSRDWWLMLIRGAAEAAAAWLFFTALFRMPIANVSAILQAMPLTVTLAAALFLGEPVGWKRFTAIIVGFVGVLLIVRPGTDSFTFDSLYAVASVACVTVRDLAVRRMSPDVPSTTVAFVTVIVVGVFSAVGSLFVEWTPVTVTNGSYLLGAVFLVLAGYILSVMAMRIGDIGAVAPFRYASLIVALITGYFVFGDWPDGITLIGASIVVGTGLFTLWRERRLRLSAEAALRIR